MNMATAYEYSLSNVTNNERAFRGVLGMVLLTKIIIGAIAAPAAMFALATIAVYLVMTAIMGLDPFYALVQRLSHRKTHDQHKTAGNAYA
jgi:hypothetical protein